MKREVKDFVGYVLGNNVELEKFERQMMDLEVARMDEIIPIEDLKLFQEKGVEEVRVLEYTDIPEEIIFEGLKGTSIMFKVMNPGDTYRNFFTKLSENEMLKRQYNVITQNVFNIYKKMREDLELAALNLA